MKHYIKSYSSASEFVADYNSGNLCRPYVAKVSGNIVFSSNLGDMVPSSTSTSSILGKGIIGVSSL